MKPRLLVIGAQGQVATSLRQAAARYPNLTVIASDRSQIDLAQPEHIAASIAAIHPDIVINPAAYTAVDRAESEPDLAFAINRDGAAQVARAAAAIGAPVIHLSTDYVFDGTKPSAYVEDDPPGPRSVYGRSKLAGELEVAAANPQHIILRTAWVYSPFGSNFLRTMARLASERDLVRVVDDQIGCPTSADDIADAVLALAERIASSGWDPAFAGVTHLAGPDAMSWRAFAEEIMLGLAARGQPSAKVEPIPSSAYPTAAARPANSRLACDRLADIFGLRTPPASISMARCLDQLFGPKPTLGGRP
ncbi:dTDP-4-dehydrorhamnose reductase [Phenylobacterium montanum]|uniref:dTDP-4-dehydrorhamnose reductase n=1 Tax=Phenylobacterium montanum TaxID=2823693 RepID=A0A975IVZ4_9CAUL|nr:dTDP-4-dehydrorhamnose reductase [Caulobacter sp. S6]QUD89295.1 dTDP-4-dehydrorhamnose reductase [Caulobacter sp. S6]